MTFALNRFCRPVVRGSVACEYDVVVLFQIMVWIGDNANEFEKKEACKTAAVSNAHGSEDLIDLKNTSFVKEFNAVFIGITMIITCVCVCVNFITSTINKTTKDYVRLSEN